MVWMFFLLFNVLMLYIKGLFRKVKFVLFVRVFIILVLFCKLLFINIFMFFEYLDVIVCSGFIGDLFVLSCWLLWLEIMIVLVLSFIVDFIFCLLINFFIINGFCYIFCIGFSFLIFIWFIIVLFINVVSLLVGMFLGI